jgi:hypothetical protein
VDVIIRKICFRFGTARGLTLTGEWRKLYNEELNDLYSSPNIVWGIKSRRMRWAGHVAHVGKRRGIYRVWVGKREGKETTWKTQAYMGG